MALPTSYLTSIKNLEGILNSIVGAKAPEKFTTRFLESLDYKSVSDRLIIAVLKSLGFLIDDGKPTQRYFEYLDQTQSAGVLAQAVSEAYSDLFQVNKTAYKMSRAEVVNKFKTLSQGQYSESVLDKMASTFVALCALSDFESMSSSVNNKKEELDETKDIEDKIASNTKNKQDASQDMDRNTKGLSIGGLVYNIQLILPESRDAKVYDALFESLRKHLS